MGIKNKVKKRLIKRLFDIALNGNNKDSLKASSVIIASLCASYKFRPVREQFHEAMNEMVVFNTPFMLLEHISKYSIDMLSVHTKSQGMDNREGWEDRSYIIIAKWNDGSTAPVGYTNHKITKDDLKSYIQTINDSKIR